MWFIIIFLMFSAVVGGFIYLISRFRRFALAQKLVKSRLAADLIGAGVLLAVFLALFLTLGVMNAMVVFLHLVLFRLLCDGVFAIFRRITGKKPKIYISGILAIVLTAVYLSSGVFFAYHVFRTEYTVTTEKTLPGGAFRIAGFSDAHMGTLITPERLSDFVDKINAEKPDAVVIVGDLIDDSTDLETLKGTCRTLANLTPEYGTYYVFGNHDAGYGRSASRGYGKEELREMLTECGVTVLEDMTDIPAPGICIAGRADKSNSGRLGAFEMMPDGSEYTVFLDHQPSDYDGEAAAGADLVISGHTHGGQMIPINRVGELIGANDRTYGYERRDNTDFIVSSGIGDWELLFKTGCISEYFIIDIKENSLP